MKLIRWLVKIYRIHAKDRLGYKKFSDEPTLSNQKEKAE